MDRIPGDWVDACNRMDEVWVPSDHSTEAFACSGVARNKLYRVPPSVSVMGLDGSTPDADLPVRRGFHFLSFASMELCSGWDVLLRAYTDAFRLEEDVCLFLVLDTGAISQREAERRVWAFVRHVLGLNPDRVPDIVLLPGEALGRRRIGLYQAANIYVQASRGQKLGLYLMEAMASGLPVIATDRGDHTEFMDEGTAYPVRSNLVKVPVSALPESQHPDGYRWAEPSADHLGNLMREVFENRDAAQRRGQAARQHIADCFSTERIALQIKERLISLTA